MRDGELSALIGSCAKCGTCRTVCTLYPERKAEIAVARGKVALVEAALAGEDLHARALREALSDCLLCGRCERACPNQVLVEEIVMKGRAVLADELGIPAWKRILFGMVLPSSRARDAARSAGRAAQKLFLGKVPAASGLHYRFPEGRRLHGRTMPEIPDRGFVASLAPTEARSGHVALFVGCVFDHLFPQIGRAAYETMKASGEAVAVVRDAACCGLPALVSGDRESARRAAAENLRRMSEAGPGRIVFPCGSCLLMFRRHIPGLFPEGDALREAADRIAGRSIDYATFVLDSGVVSRLPDPPPGARAGTIGYHDPCHLSGTLGKGREARDVLRRTVGGAFGEIPGADLCCGYGGTFNVRDYPTSSRIGERKIAAAAAGGAAVVATACSGCILQMRDTASRAAPALRIVHLAELVSAALSGR